MEESMNQIVETEQPDAQDDRQPIIFVANPKAQWHWYSLSAPISSFICLAAIIGVAIYMLADASRWTKLSGVLLLVFGIPYIVYYFYHYFSSRKYIATRAELTEDYLEASCKAYTKRFALSDLTLTFSYSSSYTLCIIAATADDYVAIPCPTCYIFSKEGTQLLKPFYAINKRLMELNKNHVNYKRNKKARKLNPFKVPQFVFETEFYTHRANALIDRLKQSIPFALAPKKAPEEAVSKYFD